MTTRILVVDDEPDLQDLVERRFRREIRKGDYAFEFAVDGQQALERVEADQDIELVVSDINMPRMDGLTLLNRLSDFESQLKTIVVSAYGDMENIRTAMNYGAFDFVTKPIDFNDLSITIKKSLDELFLLKQALLDRAEANRARANLARYFPRRLVDVLAERDEPFGPPRQQPIGLLFADIRGFTSLSESMEPSKVMEFLRTFHALTEAVVFEHGGTLTNYVGDSIFASFGVPEVGETDASNALACSKEILRALENWNKELVKENNPPIRVGVGAHYGLAVMGDIGSQRSMAFSVIGDTVNTASRLQELTRSLDTDLIVSQDLLDRVNQESHSNDQLLEGLKEAGEQEIRGRTATVKIFTFVR